MSTRQYLCLVSRRLGMLGKSSLCTTNSKGLTHEGGLQPLLPRPPPRTTLHPSISIYTCHSPVRLVDGTGATRTDVPRATAHPSGNRGSHGSRQIFADERFVQVRLRLKVLTAFGAYWCRQIFGIYGKLSDTKYDFSSHPCPAPVQTLGVI